MALTVTIQLADGVGGGVRDLLTDPVAAEGDAPWRGAVSNLGLVVWGTAAAACFLAAALAHFRDDQAHGAPFLAATGGFVLLLALDDALLVHEELAPRVLNVPELAVFLVYGILGVAWLLVYLREVRESDWLPLAIATAAAVGSVVFDQTDGAPLLEDTLKYYGLVAIVVYCFGLAYRALSACIDRSPGRLRD